VSSYYYDYNPRRYRRRRRRRNPGGFYRRNPTEVLGIDLEPTALAIGGAVGTAWLDQAVITPFAGPMLHMAGQWQGALKAVAATVAAHWLSGRFLRRWSRQIAPGANLYGVIGLANTLAPGLVPITIGPPKQLAGVHLFAATQPPTPSGAMAGAGAAASLGSGGGATVSQTGGRRIQAPNGL
jgi:hypothetical protein